MLKALRTNAEAGDANAIYSLATSYANGKKGLQENKVAALAWYRRGALLDHTYCLAQTGQYLLKGIGCTANSVEGPRQSHPATASPAAAPLAAPSLASPLQHDAVPGLFGRHA